MKYLLPCLVLCGIGLMLILAGITWSGSFGKSTVWTEAQAIKFTEVSARFHQAAHAHSGADHGHDHGHAHGGDSAAELAAAEAEWKLTMKQRDDAIARLEFWRRVLLGSGMGAIVLGGGGYLVAKNMMDDE